MPTTTSTILDQISAEKTKISERLARLDAEREKIATQLTDLEIAERVCHCRIVGRRGVNRGEQFAETRRDVWIDVPFQETLLPVLPSVGCRSDRQRAGVVIDVEDVRHRAGRKSAGKTKRLAFVDRPLAFCHPLFHDAQPG